MTDVQMALFVGLVWGMPIGVVLLAVAIGLCEWGVRGIGRKL